MDVTETMKEAGLLVTFEESAEQDMNAPRRSYNIIQTPINTVDLSSINAISSSPEAKVSSKRRTQKYRKAWEDLPECRGWLEPLDDNVYKAKCIACDKEMMADVTVIRNHAQAKKHLKNCENMQDEKLSAVCKKSFEAAKKSRKATGKAASWSTSDAKVSTDNDDIQIIDFDSLSIKGDEETEEYDYELEENDGKRYSNHSFAQPVKHKEKDNSSQSKAAVSKAAPFWKASAIVNGHVTELKLSDYKGRYIVLIFYPQDFSRVCQSELLAISDRISEFRALNAEVVACSVDSFLAHQVWCRTPRSEGGLANPKIALLSDPTHSISKDYGCFMPELGHTLRAYYIIDHRGIIRQITINDISVGRSTDELLRLVEAFQQTDETEASAPADWKSGQPLYS
ncbi:unnamed protein product [Bemisia tabaci]|uniref:thioredoxin-dependent peroxiredoxin n=1 Tax=Bemisia tabaci TaxID=7038 RepID=A0A9P0F204_BEMTA|nr:unnamed protein product [Bemisia tabaci]